MAGHPGLGRHHAGAVRGFHLRQPQDRLRPLRLRQRGKASAAELCGIPVARIRVLLVTTSGAMAALAGVLLTARLGSGNAGTAAGLDVDVIASVVMGGTSLSGGRGSTPHTEDMEIANPHQTLLSDTWV